MSTAAMALITTGAVLETARRRSSPSRVAWTLGSGAPTAGPLGGRVVGSGPVRVVLLHGMFNASSYWGAAYHQLALGPPAGRVIMLDLAGFGQSLEVGRDYGADEQADAVASTLEKLGADAPMLVGAHSIGSIIALRLAVRHPELVAGIVAFAPPWYADSRDARRRLSGADPLARLLLADDELANYVCGWMCEHRSAAACLVRLARPNLPQPLAEDRVNHTWASYALTVDNLVLAGGAPSWLDQIRAPVWMLAGSEDRSLSLALLRSLAERITHLRLSLVAGAGHDLPLSHPGECIAALQVAEQEVNPHAGPALG